MCSNGFRILVMFLFTFTAFSLNHFMPAIPVIAWYIGSINVFSLILFGIDKLNAVKERKRVPEFSFHFLSLIGGVVGVMLGIVIFRHKLNEKSFLLIQLVIFIFWSVVTFLVIKNFDAIVESVRGISGY